MKLLAAFLFLWIGVTSLEARSVPAHASALAEFSAAIEELCDSVSPAVVQIEVRSRVPVDTEDGRRAGFFARQFASGSGVIVDAAGYIVTNEHVIEGSRDIDVSVADTSDPGRKDAHKHYKARIVGTDKETDLAVLKIDADSLPVLNFRDSDKLKQGQIVFALGSPLGLENTLTVGYVSATSRQLKPEQPMSYIQTDAPINPGNSGGPLLDIDGKIAGINTMIISQSGGSEGIGFAIPGNTVRHVYELLRKEGHIQRGTIGVVAQDINPLMSQALGLDRYPGVILSDVVPHGAAEASGLEPGDVVLAIEGRPAIEARQVQAEILQHAIGDQIVLEILRGSEKMRKTVAILERPNSAVVLADLVNGQSNLVRELGILAMTLDEKVTPNLPDTRRLYGVVVAAIPAEFAAFNPDLRPGDLIYELNKTKVHSLEEMRTALMGLKPGDPIVLLVEHDGTLGYVSFTLE
ncbi:MAG: trypsin-like peptidase domain-containing protein [Bryobacteraceae bacterium]|jgi:serine protease Do